MIHFFPIFSNDASKSPLAQELRALGVPHRLFAHQLTLRYRNRIWLLLVGLPKIAWFAIKSAVRSLIISRTDPKVVILGSDIEVLVFALLRFLTLRWRTQIVYLGFIYTGRKQLLLRWLHLRYYQFVMSFVDIIICHSTLERERYKGLFGKGRTAVEFIPYGLHITDRELVKVIEQREPYILAAGRSGRDYYTLFEAVRAIPVKLHVVCDSGAMLEGLDVPSNVTVLRACYGADYVQQLINASAVVIPLGVADISAGQMVLLQAMAYAKPTIITRSQTVEDYVTDGHESLLVPQGDMMALREAIVRLEGDPALASSLSSAARESYVNRFSMHAFVRNVISIVGLGATK